jgi:UDP-N-acetylglucosamine--N-acetylmuramyl-(pentapeptide) pyrophosphoryl-undecaprenol N-acetylglucosamine transferase
MKIIIAAGGTGGHVFPGIALAEAFMAKNSVNQLLFIGTRRELDKKTFVSYGLSFEAIDAVSIKGKNPVAMFTASLYTLKSITQAMRIIKTFSPDLAVGLGGYVSGPVLLAAFLMGVKTAIHEQNTIPGLANRMLGKIANRIFISFACSQPYFPQHKTVLAGNPIRKQHLTEAEQSRPKTPFTLLVIGGSLGSHQINRALIDALEYLLPIKQTLRIIHQTGTPDRKMVQEAYQAKGFSAEVVSFIDLIAPAYSQAHLVISRSGATTLAELMIHHKAAILIPYPLAADHHQHRNAGVLVDEEAARMIDPEHLTGKCLADHILDLYHHPERLSALEQNAGKLGRPHAARNIVDCCYQLVA